MRWLVTDASTCCKWYFNEDHSNEARQLLTSSRYLLVAPNLALVEVSNVLWKRCHRGDLSVQDAQRVLTSLRQTVGMIGNDLICDQALKIATHVGHSIYDCYYIALAEKLQTFAVTGDKKMVRTFAQSPWAAHILSLADLSSSP